MEFLFPEVRLNGPVWPSLYCPGEFVELIDWVNQSRGPMLSMGFVVLPVWDPRFVRILEILTGSPDVSSV